MVQETAIIIPSLNRPHKLEELIKNINHTTPEPHNIYFMVSDIESIEILSHHGEKFFIDQGDTYINRQNFMYRNTKEPLIFTGSDDLKFHPGWLTEAIRCMEQYDVTIVNDRLNAFGTMALIKRSYLDTMSGCIDTPDVIFYPGYKHNYADTEFIHTAFYREKAIRCEESVVEHMHYANGKAEIDDTYEFNRRTTEGDRQLFLSRKHLWNG